MFARDYNNLLPTSIQIRKESSCGFLMSEIIFLTLMNLALREGGVYEMNSSTNRSYTWFELDCTWIKSVWKCRKIKNLSLGWVWSVLNDFNAQENSQSMNLNFWIYLLLQPIVSKIIETRVNLVFRINLLSFAVDPQFTLVHTYSWPSWLDISRWRLASRMVSAFPVGRMSALPGPRS